MTIIETIHIPREGVCYLREDIKVGDHYFLGYWMEGGFDPVVLRSKRNVMNGNDMLEMPFDCPASWVMV